MATAPLQKSSEIVSAFETEQTDITRIANAVHGALIESVVAAHVTLGRLLRTS